FAIREHAYVGAPHEDLLPEVSLEPVHHPDDDDERAHPDGHTSDRDHADEREQTGPAAAPEIPPGDRQLERAGPGHATHSGRISGKRITSRMCGVSVRNMK
ncbi:MAG: hypothetical protein ACK55I_48570, partial [bacterium]